MITKKKRTNRLLAMLLTFVMVCGLLPAAAFAEQPAVFKSIPGDLSTETDQTLSARISLDMNLVQDTGSVPSISLETLDGTDWVDYSSLCYDDTSSGNLTVSLGTRSTPTVEKYRWGVLTTSDNWEYSNEFTATWTKAADPGVTTISSVEITGVTEPVVGGTATMTGITIATPGVEMLSASSHWLIETSSGAWMNMSSGGYFYAGSTYGIQIQLAPVDDSYMFAETVEVTVNGKKGASVDLFGYQDKNRLIKYSFGTLTKTTPSTVSSVAVTGVTEPVIGQMPSTAGITASTGASVDTANTHWMVYKSGSWQQTDTAFEKGEIYAIQIGVQTAKAIDLFADTISATVNGQTATAVEKTGTDLKDRAILYSFGELTGTVTVNPDIVTASLPNGTAGTAYSQKISASGTTPMTWTVSGGSLPDGLTLNENVISGQPTTAGTYTFWIKAQNKYGYDTQGYNLTIDPGITTISSVTISGVVEPAAGESPTFAGITTSTPGVKIRTDYSYAYWFYDEDGTWYTLPGLFQNGKTYAVQLYLEPVDASYVFADTVAVTLNGNTVTEIKKAGAGDKARTILYSFGKLGGTSAVAPSIQQNSMPDGTVGEAYNQALTASGTAPVSLIVESGTIPYGLVFNGNSISGVPTTAGTYSFKVKATNSAGSDSKDLSITIKAAPTYSVTVNNSYAADTGAGSYEKNKTVHINAGSHPSGYSFGGWEVTGGAALDDASRAVTYFTMPENDVTVTASWVPEEISSASVTVTAPKKGETPSAEATISDTTYTAASVSWYPEDSPFMADTVYSVTIKLEVTGTKKFTGNTKFYVNGSEASVNPSPITGAIDEVSISYTFPKTEAEPGPTAGYQFTAGGGGVYIKGSGETLTFTVDAPMDECDGIKVDNAVIEEANYTLASGSTIITLTNAYLETLAEGDHTIAAIYGRIEAETDFKVLAAQVNTPVTMEIPISKTVEQGGEAAPEAAAFTFEVKPYGNPHADLSSLTITGLTIETNGADNSYTGIIKIVGDKDVIENARGLTITEKNDGLDNWTYDDTTYLIWLGDGTDGYSVTIQKDLGDNMNPQTVRTAEFTNIFTKDEEPDPENPGGNTPDDPKPEDPAPGNPTPDDPKPGDSTPGGSTPGEKPAKPAAPGQTAKPLTPAKGTSAADKTTGPKTGDQNQMMLWILLMLAACGGFGAYGILRKKNGSV